MQLKKTSKFFAEGLDIHSDPTRLMLGALVHAPTPTNSLDAAGELQGRSSRLEFKVESEHFNHMIETFKVGMPRFKISICQNSSGAHIAWLTYRTTELQTDWRNRVPRPLLSTCVFAAPLPPPGGPTSSVGWLASWLAGWLAAGRLAGWGKCAGGLSISQERGGMEGWVGGRRNGLRARLKSSSMHRASSYEALWLLTMKLEQSRV